MAFLFGFYFQGTCMFFPHSLHSLSVHAWVAVSKEIISSYRLTSKRAVVKEIIRGQHQLFRPKASWELSTKPLKYWKGQSFILFPDIYLLNSCHSAFVRDTCRELQLTLFWDDLERQSWMMEFGNNSFRLVISHTICLWLSLWAKYCCHLTFCRFHYLKWQIRRR